MLCITYLGYLLFSHFISTRNLKMASYPINKERENFLKLSIAIVDLSADALRLLLDSHIKPLDLPKKINKKNFTNSEIDSIDKAEKDGSYKCCDISLLCKILKDVCNQIICPSKGWRVDPDTNDLKVGDDVQRIRIIRNTLFHIPSSKIADTNFESNWKQLDSIMTRMNTHLQHIRGNKDFKNDLAGIYSSILSEEEERHYIDIIKRLAEFAKRMDETESKVDDLSKQREEDKKTVENLAADMNKMFEMFKYYLTVIVNDQNVLKSDVDGLKNDRSIMDTKEQQVVVTTKLMEGILQTDQKDVSKLKEQAKGSTESYPQRRESTPAKEVYDILIFHASDDRPDAIDFCRDIKEKNKDIKPNIILRDETMKTKEVDFRYRYLFVYVTDKIEERFLHIIDMEVHDSIVNKEKRDRIIPIWACTEGEEKVELLSIINGVYYLKNKNNESALKCIGQLITYGRERDINQ